MPLISDVVRGRKDLCEVVDKKGKTLCLLSVREVTAQGLMHRRIALCPTDGHKRLLLRAINDVEYDFFFSGVVAAGCGAREYAGMLAEKTLKTENVAKICEFLPVSETMRSFFNVYSVKISSQVAEMFARDRQKYLLADLLELKAIMNYGCKFSPLLELFAVSTFKSHSCLIPPRDGD